MTYTCREVCGYMDAYAPPIWKEEGDPIGLQLGSPEQAIERLFLALGLTRAIVEEAISFDADMIVVHHSPFYVPFQQLLEDELNRSVLTLVRGGIALFTAHSNLDMVPGGVSDVLAQRLGLSQTSVLQPWSQQQEAIGLGRIGDLEESMPLEQFAYFVGNALETDGIRYVGQKDQMVKRIACCGGSGAYLYEEALAKGADCYVTADVKYHDALIAWETGPCLIDAGHWATENPVMPVLATYLQEKMPELSVHLSQNKAEPFTYAVSF